jgi:glycosyltransferase involved in cell wall biosynthesis
MGGSEYQVQVLMEHLTRRPDLDIHFVTNRVGAGFEPHGYELRVLSREFGIRRYGLFFDAVPLYRILRRLAPDVIYQVIGSAHTGIAAFYARRHGCRLIWRVTDEMSLRRAPIEWWRPHHRLERLILEYGIRNATTIVAQTETQRRLLAESFGRADAVVVRNFHPRPREEMRKGAAKKRILWIANLKRIKNPEAFIRLAARFRDRSDVEFTVLGAPADHPDWVQTVEEQMRRCENLRYAGPVSPEEVNAQLAAAHLLVNTSDTEGFSNTFIQAWMREVPVVSLAVDPDGVFSSSSPSLLAGSEERLYELVELLLGNEALRGRLAAECRAAAAERYTEANAERLVEIIAGRGTDRGR